MLLFERERDRARRGGLSMKFKFISLIKKVGWLALSLAQGHARDGTRRVMRAGMCYLCFLHEKNNTKNKQWARTLRAPAASALTTLVPSSELPIASRRVKTTASQRPQPGSCQIHHTPRTHVHIDIAVSDYPHQD